MKWKLKSARRVASKNTRGSKSYGDLEIETIEADRLRDKAMIEILKIAEKSRE